MRESRGRRRVPWSAFLASLIVTTLVAGAIGLVAGGALRTTPPSSDLVPSVAAVAITQFSFSPQTISSGSQTNGTVTLSGGTSPYYLWFNQTPSNCNPPSEPVTSSGTTFSFMCNPSSTGTFTIHLDVVDSSTPATKASQTANLMVNSGNNNNNNSNNKGSNNGGNNSLGSLLPSGLLQIAFILAFVVIACIVATAVGVVALAVLVPRRLRQINETLGKSGPPTTEPKPPT